MPRVNFADQATGRIYLHIAAGIPVWSDATELRAAMANEDTRVGLAAVMQSFDAGAIPETAQPIWLAPDSGGGRAHTLGHWGTARP